ncbi:ABC transporter ATP-binding protein [Adhaeribacter rhizoryzae]|uniref:ABC transporter ATP-binding protein n=1 Tax=Adhaeribacter rhizoryzae TaxID=2607907 RepID=A0A5M6CZX8_9BACT|nr:ABC transporter ATP-binding protein [Adhaeribacter rhizoryzae]KAA5539980.1 ABC transporter ATP-binding protein [Adhaeribacter rhizoryzae]
MIEIKNITKAFGKLQVLKGIDINLEKGKIYAFLGPNGSGKTTLIKTILGLNQPDNGEILIQNENIKNNWQYKSCIGYMPQIARFPENLNMMELLGMTRDIRKTASDEEKYISYFNLEGARDKKLKNLSGGTKQKVNAVLAFMFNPDILIFDEPSVGLDPVAHLKLKDLMREERDNGKTILLTTHILSEVEELADEVIFLLDGKIYFQGTVQNLVQTQNESNLERAIAQLLLQTEKKSKKLSFQAA